MHSSFKIVCNMLFSGRYSLFNFCRDIHLLLKLRTKKGICVNVVDFAFFSC